MSESILVDEPISPATILLEDDFIYTDIFGEINNFYQNFDIGEKHLVSNAYINSLTVSHPFCNPSNDSKYISPEEPVNSQQFQLLIKEPSFDNYFIANQSPMTGQTLDFKDNSKVLLLNGPFGISNSYPIEFRATTEFDKRRESRKEYNRNSARRSRQRKKEFERILREKIAFYEFEIPRKKQELEIIIKKIEELKVEYHFYSFESVDKLYNF
ncbi:14100_t:CDS:2 [Ambispora leptoticha]|uniref:14100_t:CDS:1 n=1 Tax=Ambispora leptoticha TaxID=144679 RepID=A0A9N9BG49_9GLOM|nr:14100_t:CDS:2 [Ambispora leptoticha]